MRHAGALSVGSWARLVYLALFCSVFAFAAQTWAVRRTSPSRASLLMGTEPVWAVAIGIGIGGERLTVLAAAGAALIVAATVAGQRIEREHSQKVARAGGQAALPSAVVPIAPAVEPLGTTSRSLG
jgi:drug/metabolite transporter (DMT)-like permease